eukprot:3076129-Amphidinium_carterae.1
MPRQEHAEREEDEKARLHMSRSFTRKQKCAEERLGYKSERDTNPRTRAAVIISCRSPQCETFQKRRRNLLLDQFQNH